MKIGIKISLLVLFGLLMATCPVQARTLYSLVSPDGKLEMQFLQADKGTFGYTFSVNGKTVIDFSPVGYRLKGGTKVPSAGWVVENSRFRRVRSVWKPVWGKREIVPDRFNEVCLRLSPARGNTSLALVFTARLYNDGLAFRYEFPFPETGNPWEKELTGYCFSGDYTAWYYNGEQANLGPEKLSETEGNRRPVMTVQVDQNCFLALHEADLRAGSPLLLSSEKGKTAFEAVAEQVDVSPEGYSAWRVIMAADRPGKLVDSHLLELLNPDPEPGTDFSWVKPGVYVWDWRINGAVTDRFTYAMNYQSWVRMVDFAAAEGFCGLVLDANWYGPEHQSESDPLKGGSVADVKRIIRYGKERGVDIWLYLNDVGGREYPIEETLRQYGAWGAAGIKYGFMKGSPVEKNIRTRFLTELCAKNRLAVDFHDGPVHPYGQMRTWPNAVTREYCHAQLDAHRVFTPSTFLTSVFVNMLAGPLDMNNGMFDLRQGPTTRIDENQPVPSTVVAEAARTLLVFSGATILPDIPEYYRKYPELLSFLSAQKMPWKESRTLAGKIGEYMVMMRQTADAYLVAAATNESARTLAIPLSFLPAGEFGLQLVQDGPEAHYLTNRETCRAECRRVNAASQVTVRLAPGGGACLLIRKRLPDCLTARRGWPLVSRKLQTGRSLTIAFLGGSITQAPGYRVQFGEWLKAQYPETRFELIDAGIGGTGSDLGVARVDEQVLSSRPDLVFVEFAVNDAHTDSLQIVRSMEGIVRKIKKQSAKTDICFLYTTNIEQQETILSGNHARSARIMEQVARYYGIPSVSFDFAVADYLRQGKLVMKGIKGDCYGDKIVFTTDGTHPTPEGHQIYTQTLIRAFGQLVKPGAGSFYMPARPLCSTNYEQARMVPVQEKWLSSGWQLAAGEHSVAHSFRTCFPRLAVTDRTGESVTFRFRGTRFGLFDVIGPATASLKISVDGASPVTLRRFDGYCTYYRPGYVWLPELPDGLHTVRIETDCTPFDKISLLHKPVAGKHLRNPDFESFGIYIGKILLAGTLAE